MKKSITPEQELAICNLVSSKGLSVAEAKKQVLFKPEASVEGGSGDQESRKLSAAEKKAALVPEFEALGVETPPEGDSLAKWEQALAAAKEVTETQTEGGDTEAADLM